MNRLFGSIMMCVMRDDLIQRARAGDEKAWAILRRLLPPDLPKRELQRLRDERLQQIAAALRGTFSERAIAKLLADAGVRLRSSHGRLPDHGLFARLDTD